MSIVNYTKSRRKGRTRSKVVKYTLNAGNQARRRSKKLKNLDKYANNERSNKIGKF